MVTCVDLSSRAPSAVPLGRAKLLVRGPTSRPWSSFAHAVRTHAFWKGL